MPSTHLHHADAHVSLLISAHPAIRTHSLPSFVAIFSLIMLAVVNCNLPVSDPMHSLYDTGQRPVAISALYLSIHSLLIFFVIAFLLFLSLSTHLHRADAHCTLLISAHPANIAHYFLSWFILVAVGNLHAK